MKAKLKVDFIEDFSNGKVYLSSRYIDVTIPKRSLLLKGMKLKGGDFLEISLKKLKKKR